MAKENVFQRLNKVIRGGPIIKRRISSPNLPRETPFGGRAYDKFVRQSQELINYANFANYQAVDRWSRYSDFSEMESRAEIAAALQIYADEACSVNDRGEILRIRSDNSTIRAILETLFYDTLELEYNLSSWVRTLCKYGDFALFNDIDPAYGVLNCVPIPITDFQRIEGVNPYNPRDVVFAVSQDMSDRGFSMQIPQINRNYQAELSNMGYQKQTMTSIFDRWGTPGERGLQLQYWQVEHFRLKGNDLFLPYGTSILDPARRLWRLLYMHEDLMLMERAYRASDKRVFYIDRRGVKEDDLDSYMENAINAFKREPAVIPDRQGGYDYVFNPFSSTDDIFIPVNGPESGTRVEPLAGSGNATEVESLEYLHKQMFAALNMPPSYLGYGEGAVEMQPHNLSQVHIRFARNINRIQRVVLKQLYKMAYIHLICHNFTDDDLTNFTLELASPSSAAQEQFLNGMSRRAEVASSILSIEGLAGRGWVRKEIMGWDEEQIQAAERSRIEDIEEDAKVARKEAELSGDGEGGDGGGGFGGGLGDDADFSFDSLQRNGVEKGQILKEIVDLVESEGLDEEEATDRILTRIRKELENKKPYRPVSPNAPVGSVAMPSEGERELRVAPITPVPSPSQKAGWELEDEEDVLASLDTLFEEDQLPPVGLDRIDGAPILPERTDSRESGRIVKGTRNKHRPIEPSEAGPEDKLATKRIRRGVNKTRPLSDQDLLGEDE